MIVEIRAVKELATRHEAQLLKALRATNIEVGLLANFGRGLRFRRFVFTNDRKRLHEQSGLSVTDQGTDGGATATAPSYGL